jgi:hypothetical protein
MAQEPDERYETAGDFVDALETSLSGGIAVTADRHGHRRRARSPGHYVGAAGGVPRSGATTGNGNGHSGGRAGSRGTGSWNPPTHTQARRAASRGGSTGSWSTADTIQRGSTRRRVTGRLVALVALLVAIGGVSALALSGLGGSAKPVQHASRTRPKVTVRHTAQKAAPTPKPAASHTSTQAQAPTSTAPATPAPPSASELQLTGHDELLAGKYPEAIATLRKAVSAADPSSTTYAYGLYDLGVALLRSGDPADAVPVLEQRLKIDNQTGVVQQTLNEALQASGQAPAAGAHHGRGKAKGPAHGGGAGGDGLSGGAGLKPPGQGGNEHSNFVD